MIPIAKNLSDLIRPTQLREDEYLGEDGLIYCSKCRTVRQKRIAVAGKTIEPRCMCACQAAAYEQQEQERRHWEFLDRVEKNRSVGLTDPVLRKHTFENDLGVERNSEFAREQVFSVIDSRYRSQLPMIVTTNLTPEQMRNPEDLARARIYDRVLERCTPIRIDSQNIRKQNKMDNLKKSKRLLGDT